MMFKSSSSLKIALMVLLLVISFCVLIYADTKVYFSPLDNCSDIIVREIGKATKSVDVAIFGFTDKAIADSLVLAKKRGVKVYVYRDRLQSKESKQKAINKYMADNGIPVQIKQTGILMHMKMLIVDGSTVVTGSYNWSEGAKKQDNDLIICDAPCPAVDVYLSKYQDMTKRIN